TSVKVGEWTRAVIPSPRARPLTSCVFPAPRSPHKPITRPSEASRPHDAPSASVSSGLCEMHVAMLSQWSHPLPVFDCDAFAGGDLANAAQPQVRELLFPRIQERHGVTTGYRKEQLKILAVCHGRHQRRLGGGTGFGGAAGLRADWNRSGE